MDGMQIIRARRGLMKRLSIEMGFAANAVNKWQRVPAEYLVEVERISRIPREVLRPDIFDIRGRDVDWTEFMSPTIPQEEIPT